MAAPIVDAIQRDKLDEAYARAAAAWRAARECLALADQLPVSVSLRARLERSIEDLDRVLIELA